MMKEKKKFEQEDDLTTLEWIGFCVLMLIVWVFVKVESFYKWVFRK